ncbi:MAG: phosphatidylglycerophosphatase A [Deltaproteobacteria bacterium]|nr:phosphatidylglycerophosphatase A [Deltaproteobacteria bacterium]
MQLSEKIAVIFATGLGIGYSPFAPGTMGSLFAVFLFTGLSHLNLWIYLFTLTTLFFVGLWAVDIAGGHFNDVDSPKIVLDEILGILISYSPLYLFPTNLLNLLVGFTLFRIFDILKPFPINRVNNIKKPIYVLLDDIIAAIYAATILSLINSCLPLCNK